MSTNETDALVRLLKVLNDGMMFYKEAKKHVGHDLYPSLFEKHTSMREELIRDLQAVLFAKSGKIIDGHTVASKLRLAYTNILGMINDTDLTWVHQLEKIEVRTLNEMHKFMEHARNPEILRIIRQKFPAIQRCHDEMRQLEITIS